MKSCAYFVLSYNIDPCGQNALQHWNRYNHFIHTGVRHVCTYTSAQSRRMKKNNIFTQNVVIKIGTILDTNETLSAKKDAYNFVRDFTPHLQMDMF